MEWNESAKIISDMKECIRNIDFRNCAMKGCEKCKYYHNSSDLIEACQQGIFALKVLIREEAEETVA